MSETSTTFGDAPLPPSSNPHLEDPEIQSADARLARERNSLSLEARERIFAEIHGVAEDNLVGLASKGEDVESPSNIARMVAEMDRAIEGSISRSRNRRIWRRCPKIRSM